MRWRVCGDERRCAKDVTSDDQALLTICFVGKDKTKWGTAKGSTQIRRRWQNHPGLLAKQGKPQRPSKHGPLVTNETVDKSVQQINHVILSIQPNFSSASGAKLTDKFI
jgi:hypothetical protein